MGAFVTFGGVLLGLVAAWRLDTFRYPLDPRCIHESAGHTKRGRCSSLCKHRLAALATLFRRRRLRAVTGDAIRTSSEISLVEDAQ